MKNPDHTPIERLLSDAKEYLIAQKNLALTIGAQKGGTALYALILAIALFMIGWFFLLIFSMGIAFGIGALLESTFWGYMIVAAIYLLTGVLVWVFRDRILKTPILMTFFKMVDNHKAEAYEQESSRQEV